MKKKDAFILFFYDYYDYLFGFNPRETDFIRNIMRELVKKGLQPDNLIAGWRPMICTLAICDPQKTGLLRGYGKRGLALKSSEPIDFAMEKIFNQLQQFGVEM